jgi:cytochrome oxidase Cu insertion factor (SCO1/SenC/PrrC family)
MPQASSLRARWSSVLAGGVAVAIVLSAQMARAQTAGPDSWPEESLYRDAFRFTDDAGASLDMSSFQGRQVVLTMFYTRCRSACPITVDKLRQIDKAFEERRRPVEIVLVSYDPTDSPRRLARYRAQEKLSPQWHLLCGMPEHVERLARRIGLGRYLDMGDDIFHAFRIVLLDETGVVKRALESRRDPVPSLFEDEARRVPTPDR